MAHEGESTRRSPGSSTAGRVWSHSRLACFEKCPKQFHYRYVLRVPVETESIEAFVGKRVHEILERLYLFVREGRVPSLRRVIERFHAEWTARFDRERVRIARGDTPPEFYRECGEQCLRNYYRRSYPFDGEETLAVEERVHFSLDDAGRYRVQGVIDRLVRARDGALEIHDYKTGRRVPPQRVLDEDRQLALYQMGVDAAPETPVRLVWHYLLLDQVRVSTRAPEQLDRLRDDTMALIDRIHAEERFEPKPSPLCGWCEFQEICPASTTRAAGEPAPHAAAARAPGPPRDAPAAPEAAPSGAQLPLL